MLLKSRLLVLRCMPPVVYSALSHGRPTRSNWDAMGPQARNGFCDDGRLRDGGGSRVQRPVLCDLGTDCDDCGPWETFRTVLPRQMLDTIQ